MLCDAACVVCMLYCVLSSYVHCCSKKKLKKMHDA